MRTLTTQETRAASGGTLCLSSLFSLQLCVKVTLPKLPVCTLPSLPKCEPVHHHCEPKPRCGGSTTPGTGTGGNTGGEIS